MDQNLKRYLLENYKSASQFLRDVITQKLTVKPQQSENVTEYFSQTKRIANILESLIEEDPLRNNTVAVQFGDALHALQQNLQTIRNLAIDSHNAQTAEILALHFLDSSRLRELYRNKLELEDAEL